MITTGYTKCVSLFLLAFAKLHMSSATGFLMQSNGSFAEVAAVVGCGEVCNVEMQEVEKDLLPLWRVLPKTAWGRINRRSLRYLAHQYFVRTSSLVVRGLEPGQLVTDSASDILSERIPDTIDSLPLDRAMQGFTLSDATIVVTALRQAISDFEWTFLEEICRERGVLSLPGMRVSFQEELAEILDDFMLNWIVGDSARGLHVASLSHRHLQTAIPAWDNVLAIVRNQIRAFDFQSGATLEHSYSLDDVYSIVGNITRSFAWFHKTDCDAMETHLIRMDTRGTGRVPLSNFWAAGKSVDWRFAESVSHLRDLGALDETSVWHGHQVIIPNYLQAASNCIVSTSYYSVCCTSRCDEVRRDIEVAVGAPVGSPQEILEVVGTLTPGFFDDEEPLVVPTALRLRLDEIATGGGVRLHGRLFAQWLHYVFPRECAFPHKGGTVSAFERLRTKDVKVTEEEITSHAGSPTANWSYDSEGTEWMTQWSAEEELMAGHESPCCFGFVRVVGWALLLSSVVSIGLSQFSDQKQLDIVEKLHVV